MTYEKLTKLMGLLLVVILVGTLGLGMIGCGDDDDDGDDGDGLPGDGVTVSPGRATWNTGYFQAEITVLALQELGYNVERPTELDNSAFYVSVAQGDLDYWPNGWFPLHNTYLTDDVRAKVSLVGYLAKGGALQGYLIDKATSEEYDITNIDQFKDPEIAELFDADGNGKADLVACPPGWGCEKVITHHMDAYDLSDTVEPLTVDYAIGMADAITRYNKGESIFFYTWTPNWTVNALVPGEDVVWLEVPYPDLPEEQKDLEDATSLPGVVGCVDDPCEMGWPANDIRIVANKDFLSDNPAARALFEAMEIPLEDIFAQNAKMNEGENSEEDVIRHAEEWVEGNQAMFNAWISQAMTAAD